MSLTNHQIKDLPNWETLTIENAKPRAMRIVNKNHPEWGTKMLDQDRNGFIAGSGSNGRMLDAAELHHWAIYP